MSTTKTVKVTNGKILNYTITKPGYKTVHGSKLITADTTINVNMIPESDPSRDVYVVGDRIGGVATFVTYYTDGNGNKYAVFVADAQYRVASATWDLESMPGGHINTGLNQYTTSASTEASNVDSASYCNQYILDTYYPAGDTLNRYPAFKAAHDAVSIPELGTAGVAKLPNPFELLSIANMGATLDSYDPTVQDYMNNNLSNWKKAWTCYEHSQDSAILVQKSSTTAYLGTGYKCGYYDTANNMIIPVFEIPVNS